MLWIAAFCVSWLLLAGAGSLSAAEPVRLPRENLLLFRDAAGATKPVTNVEQWTKRREEILRGMESVMGKLPGAEKRVPFEMRVEEEVDAGTFLRRRITYLSEPNCRTPAYLLIPKVVLDGTKKAPGVLALHGTNMEIGHGSIVGVKEIPNRGYGVELANRGYVVIAPNYPIMAGYQPDIKSLGWESGTLKAVWDNMRALDLLVELQLVDAPRFGAIGHSLGGHNSVYTAVFDPRIEAVVSSCGLDSYLDYYDGDPKRWEAEQGWCQTRYMPKLANYKGRLDQIPFDFHEMIGAIAPRSMLILAPTMDHNFRAASVDRVAQAAADVYKLYGHPDRLKVSHPEGKHDFTPEMHDEAFRFLDAVLLKK